MLSALERLIIWLLRPILRRLLGRKASSVDMELQSGVLRLSDVELSRKTLAGLSLPLTISSATVRKLEVLLPWRKGVQLSTPFVVRIDGVSAVLCARMEAADWIFERGFHLRESYEMEVGGALKDFDGNRGMYTARLKGGPQVA